MQHDIPPAVVGQFLHGLGRQTVCQMYLQWDDLCAEKMGYPVFVSYWVQNISVHPFLSPVSGKMRFIVDMLDQSCWM